MGVRVEARAEPIPGYKLIERLGGGGFGEVWKAEAPGGLFKAIKFVYGDLQTAGDDGCRAEQELKGLSRVKTVHHPYILSLERFDIIDGQLIIVMELADRTIWDRFQECRGQGLPGIPRQELLDYLLETAEALDLMNIQYQLQHLDIKPQNIFLSHNHIKVADFGLVKDLEGMNGATVTGGVTPVYAAPETFDGRISRFSDQYSLAIVYQELLTGVRPFAGSTMRQLVLQHLQGTPDLSSLPVADRPVILRGLAKSPDDRYPTCTEMIKSLGLPKKSEPAAAPAPAAIAKDKMPQVVDQQTTRGVRSKKDRVPEGTGEPSPGRNDAGGEVSELLLSGPLESQESVPLESSQPLSSLLAAAAGLSGPLDSRMKTAPPVVHTPGGRRKPDVHNTPAIERAVRRPADIPQKPVTHETGVLQPALVIGLGKMGIDTLKQIRKQLNMEFGPSEALPQVRLIALDTDQESIQSAVQGDEQTRLRLGEVLHTALHRPSHYLKHDVAGLADGWLDSRMIYRIPRQVSRAGTRSLGRLAFVDNYRVISRRLEAELQACCSDDTLHEVSEHIEIGLRTRVPRIYVVTNLAGTTGGGMFVDVAYVMRQMLRRQGYNNAEVVGVLYLPSIGDDPVRRRAMANTYAALTELQHFSSGESVFRSRYVSPDGSGTMKPFSEAGPPFHRSYLLRLPEPRPGSLSSVRDASEVVDQAGAYIFRDLATSLGKELDTRRAQAAETALQTPGPAFCSVGLYRLVWPRRLIMEQAGRDLCKRLIDRWLSKDASAQSEEIRDWSHQEWETQGFRAEDLIAQHHDKCEKLLKQAPERLYMQIIVPLAEQMAKTGDAERLNIGPAVTAMDQLEKLLGVPEECRPKGPTPEPSAVEKALSEVAAGIADMCDKKLAELIVHHLIEEPRFRLAGAEEALRQFSAIAEQSLQAHEQLAKELSERTVALYHRIHKIFDAPVQNVSKPATSIWKGAFMRRTPDQKQSLGAELVDAMKSYAKCCYQSLVLHHITRLYVSLRGLLSDQVREVGFCRQRLRELASLVAGSDKEPEKPKEGAREKYLLPEGCVDLKDAIEKISGQVGAEDLLTFDNLVQQLLQQEFQALVHVCMGPSSLVKNLAPALLHEAIRFLEPHLEGTDAAQMYLAQHTNRAQLTAEVKEEVQTIFNATIPKLTKTAPDSEMAIITLPVGEASDRLRNLFHAGAPQALVLSSTRSDEILFFREQGPLVLKDLEQFGPLGEEAYRKQKSKDPTALHTREDIPEWQDEKVES